MSVACALLVAIGASAAPAAAATPRRSDAKVATEVCERMVREAVEAVIEQKLPTPQQGAWQGRTYTCTYEVGDGSLALRVQVLRDNARAKAAYVAARHAASIDQTFHGLGQQAFQADDGTLVARKDRFLLTADPSLLPARLTKRDVTFAAVAAVLSCWTGKA